MDKFHCEPENWRDLFEFLNYSETCAKIQKYFIDEAKAKNGK
jgi:hypothetical protein